MADAKESLKMVLQIIETHAVQRAEHLTCLLIDLLNTTDCRDFFDEKLQSARKTVDMILEHMSKLSQIVSDKQRLANRQLYNLGYSLNYISLFECLQSMRDMVVILTDTTLEDAEVEEIKKLLADSDVSDVTAIADMILTPTAMHFVVTRASCILEDRQLSGKDKIAKLWKGIIEPESELGAASGEDEKHRGGKVLHVEDFEKRVRKCKVGVEDFLRSIDENIRGLEMKLRTAKSNSFNQIGAAVVNAPLVGIPVRAVVRISGMNKTIDVARRFEKRQDKNWFQDTEEFLFSYIRGNKTVSELADFIQKEELEEDRNDIREALKGWIVETLAGIDKWKIPIKSWKIPQTVPLLNKEGIIAEFQRTWAFTKALLLNDEDAVELHSQWLRETIRAACSIDGDIAPVISLGRVPSGSRKLKLKFVLGKDAKNEEIEQLVYRIAEITGGSVSGGNQLADENETEFEIVFRNDQEQDLRNFMQQVVTKMGELAELHVRIAMLGDFDVSSGSRLTNPAYNRIYGYGQHMSGFLPTCDFGYLDYSGEKYFCPNGWRRISINVASSAAEFDRKYGGWHVAYHGTKHVLAATILTSGFLPSLEGVYLDPGDEAVYFSPSIVYASHPRYSEVYEVTDDTGKTKRVQMVLQVRVNPLKVWKKEAGTLYGALSKDHPLYCKVRDGVPADPNFPGNENLEWLIKPSMGKTDSDAFCDAFVVYGIMIRDYDDDPTALSVNAWWEK